MRLWIAAILLFVFACQALPLTVVGKALTKVQLSIADDDTGNEDGDSPIPDSKVKKQAPLLEGMLHQNTKAAAVFAVRAAQMLVLHRADHLPVIYAGEITSPPPDRC